MVNIKEILKVKREKLLFEIDYNNRLIKNQRTGKEIREELKLQNRALNFTLIEYNAELAKSPKKVKETAEEVQKLNAID